MSMKALQIVVLIATFVVMFAITGWGFLAQ